MTILFRSAPITSAEQAEALPEGTLAHGHWPDRQYGDGLVKKIGGAWMPRSASGIGIAPSDALVGWAALVPIEAEEETRHGLVGLLAPDAPHDERRLVTRWEPS